jgi:hypothetical protein
MAVIGDEWLDLIEREYLRGFVAAGGAVIKFVVGSDDQTTAVERGLRDLSERHQLGHVAIDAATTRIHMTQDVFFAIARTLDWPAMAQYFVEELFDRQGYEWPHAGQRYRSRK